MVVSYAAPLLAVRGGPFLGDTLAMGQAALDLYGATGSRTWLATAASAGSYIAANFTDPAGGFTTTLSDETSVGVFLKRYKPLDEQVQVARFANRLHRYTGRGADLAMAEHAGRYVTSDAVLELPRPLPGVLLVDGELAVGPTHITVVGSKSDATARSLHATARAYPGVYKRVDWWDRSEGKLPNPDIEYPELDRAAAFACTNRLCSLPSFSGDELASTVKRMVELSRPGSTP